MCTHYVIILGECDLDHPGDFFHGQKFQKQTNNDMASYLTVLSVFTCVKPTQLLLELMDLELTSMVQSCCVLKGKKSTWAVK